jgi:hypothetical protein
MSTYVFRFGRIGVVIAVIFFFAAGPAIAKPKNSQSDLVRERSVIVTLVKTPVLVVKNIAIAQDKLERHVSSTILHAGVVAFTRAIRWFSHEESPKAGSSPSSFPKSL